MPTYTQSEIEAYRLLYSRPTTNELIDFHAAGNRIIQMAEKIKADRAITAMER